MNVNIEKLKEFLLITFIYLVLIGCGIFVINNYTDYYVSYSRWPQIAMIFNLVLIFKMTIWDNRKKSSN